MEEKYKNKYNISSSRLTNWDYGANGAYFVTICTKDRIRYFGEIEEIQSSDTQSVASLQPTEIGKVALHNWGLIPSFHPYVELDEFTVMQDHVHGILFINKPEKTNWELNKFGPQRNNLASTIRGYKSSVKTYAVKNEIEFFWQQSFYDRVIRSDKEYWNIKEYIRNNPDQWYLNGDNFENLFKP